MDTKARAIAPLVFLRVPVPLCLCVSVANLFEDQYRSRDHRRPASTLVAHGALRYVSGAHNLVRQAIDLFFLVPRLVGVELHIERGGNHLGGKLFGVVSGDVVSLAEGVMLAQIAISTAVSRNRHSNGGGRQAARLPRAAPPSALPQCR